MRILNRIIVVVSVEVVHLTKKYGPQFAVNNVSFEAKQGEIIGFLGPNGAGKSTTMKIATGYLPSTSGSVKVCGFDVNESPLDVQKNIGYLPEHNPLYLDMYIKEYLSFTGSLHKLSGKKLRTRVAEMIELTGLTIEQNKKVGALSKGYRQRVGLAQALIHDPKVLILDEPTTGLDPNQIVEIRNLIKQISQDKTVIFSTHIMQEVQAICDRAVIINRGEIAADGKIADLMASGSDEVQISVEFTNPIKVEYLKNIDAVTSVTEVSDRSFVVHCNEGKDVRSDIFKLAIERNWDMIGLSVKEHSLEEVFQQLTVK